MRTNRKSKPRPKQGGIRRQPGVSNIKPVRLAKGVGPTHSTPGFAAKSLRTHVRVKSAGSKATFAL